MKTSQITNIIALFTLARACGGEARLRGGHEPRLLGSSQQLWVTPDIAQNSTVSVSSTFRDFKIYDAHHLVDGNSGTRWTSGYADNQTIDIDLGDAFPVDMVRLNWEDAHALSYDLLLSSDGSTWVTVASTDNSTGAFEEVTFESREAQYVKLNMHTRATEYGFSLWDFEVYKTQSATGEPPSEPTTGLPAPTTPNFALSSAVHASTTYKDWQQFNIQNMVDGDTGTRWASERHGNGNQKIYVDLGETYDIDRIRIGWEEAHAQSYELMVSTDGDDWTTVYSTKNCTGGLEDVAFASQEGRYVHLNLLTSATEFGFSIWDLEVYGTVQSESARAPCQDWLGRGHPCP